MSTRAQIMVIEEHANEDRTEEVMLYRHCDGYPAATLPLLVEAWSRAGGWQGGRAGKAASFLCAVDPGGFEPEQGLELHGDIDYLYRLYVTQANTPHQGSLAEEPLWEVEILQSPEYADEDDGAAWKSFWEEPTVAQMRITTPRCALAVAIAQRCPAPQGRKDDE